MSRLPIAMPVTTKSNGRDSNVEMNRHSTMDISPEDVVDDDEYSNQSGSDEDSKHDPFTQLYQAISQRIVVASKALVIASKIIKQLQNTKPTHKHITQQEATDDTHIQQSLRDSISEAHIVIQQMEKLMLKFSQLPLEGTKQQQSDRRLQRSRLTKDYTDVVKKNKQISEIAKKLTTFDYNQTTKGHDVDMDSETTSLIAANSYQQSQAVESDVDLSEPELAEREEQARRKHQFMLEMERDVVHVHDMFRDLNQLVNLQQAGIDSIEAGIMSTAQQTRMGAEQLLQAEGRIKERRKNQCCLILLAVLATLVFVLFLWVIL